MINFLKEVQMELTKVTFPARNEVIRLTAIVLAISIIVGLFSGFADIIFTKLLEYLIK